jgi:hypothetical protein
MNVLREYQLMLVGSLIRFKGATSKYLQENCDWLRGASVEVIDRQLMASEKKGWVRAGGTNGRIIYFATTKGKKQYEIYSQS